MDFKRFVIAMIQAWLDHRVTVAHDEVTRAQRTLHAAEDLQRTFTAGLMSHEAMPARKDGPTPAQVN